MRGSHGRNHCTRDLIEKLSCFSSPTLLPTSLTDFDIDHHLS